MGTASYMSPEQAAGKPVDKRADIWSFGVVFWEMLSGRKLFDGETISHTLADVLRADIDLSQLPASTPPAIRKLIGRCLDRNVKTRLRDLGEARIIIDDVLNGRSTDALPTTTISHPSKLGWIIAGVLAAALVPASIGWLRKPAQPPRPLMRFESDEMAPYKPAISPTARASSTTSPVPTASPASGYAISTSPRAARSPARRTAVTPASRPTTAGWLSSLRIRSGKCRSTGARR